VEQIVNENKTVPESGAAISDAAGWPVNDYRVNEGDVGSKKIAFIGASYLFVHKVLRDMLLVGGFDNVHVTVHDIDPVPMNLVADLLERIARQQQSRVRVSRTLDLGEALDGADAALLSISTGGLEADTLAAEVCARHGIPVAIGDTMGPAALARNLRTVPVAVGIAREMERRCPDAMLLNFTNPMSCVTGAMARNSRIPVFGLCHSADELYRYFSRVFGCHKSEVELQLAGVNHQSFVTRLWVRGRDRTADILEATQASDACLEDNLLDTTEETVDLQQAVYRVLGVWPSTGHTHLAEFYRYFLHEPGLSRAGLAPALQQPQPGRQRIERRPCPDILKTWAYGDAPVGDLDLLTNEHAHELMWARWTGEPYTRSLNVLNAGDYVQGIDRNACVEIVAKVSGAEVTAPGVSLPAAAHSLVQRWTTIHDLTIQAALACDRQAARQALFLDPHVQDFYDIDALLDDCLVHLAEWLPEAWRSTAQA
jgi:alpha-galactosidase